MFYSANNVMTTEPLAQHSRKPIDMHVHIVGNGSGGTGCWLRVTGFHRLFATFMLRQIGLPQGALEGDLDRLYAERFLHLVRESSLGAAVLLAHDPRRLTEASALNIPLVLSGHTHGGQVVLPIVGALAAQKFPVVWGIGRRDRTTMFVSRGVGTIYLPVRVNCPPEVAILTLQAA